MSIRQRVYCILPPYLLREISLRGSPTQRAMALRTITAAEQVRTQRRTRKEFTALMKYVSAGGK